MIVVFFCSTNQCFQFLKSLRTNINVPNDGKYLRGFPFITSLNISKAVLDSFENLGALHMGYDAYEQENVLFNEHKSCLVFVENKFVTFAVYERMGQKMFKAAEIHKLWTVTYYAPGAKLNFYHYSYIPLFFSPLVWVLLVLDV